MPNSTKSPAQVILHWSAVIVGLLSFFLGFVFLVIALYLTYQYYQAGGILTNTEVSEAQVYMQASYSALIAITFFALAACCAIVVK